VSNHVLAFVVVVFGGGLGSGLRHAVNQACAALFGVTLGWGTLAVNILGSLAMGMLAGWFALEGEGGQTLRLFLTTGLLGGFTTFSAFSLDVVLLWERGQMAAAAGYVAASVGIAILAVLLGLAIVKRSAGL
jgi:CrcB protein